MTLKKQFPENRTVAEKIKTLPSSLEEVIVGQPRKAFTNTADSIKNALADPDRKTLGVILISGLSGSGKTMLAMEASKHLGLKPVIIDGAALSSEDATKRFIGSAPGFVGMGDGLFGELKDSHFSVIFDEAEKAPMETYRDLLLPIIMEGEIETLNTRKKVSFRNSPVFLISNEKSMIRVMGNMTAALIEYSAKRKQRGLETDYPPLLDTVTRAAGLPASLPDTHPGKCPHVSFDVLDKNSIARIIRFNNKKLSERIKELTGHTIEISEDAINQYMASASTTYGARTARIFQSKLIAALNTSLDLSGRNSKPLFLKVTDFTPAGGFSIEHEPAPKAASSNPPTPG